MITIQKWGNSQGLRIPKEIMEMAGFKLGDPLNCQVKNGILFLKQKPKKRKFSKKKGYSLAELLKQIPDNWEPEEIDWGAPQGKEVW